jgi:aspartyl-tRNA(Asn)/glutamyl-tRNA(Gln) amidotransferase subunit C
LGGGDADIINYMILSLEEVEHIALLARLELTEEEKRLYREQLSAILDYARRLRAVPTADIPPTSSVLPPRSTLRPDQVSPGLSLEDLLRNAPNSSKDQFRVPPVLE